MSITTTSRRARLLARFRVRASEAVVAAEEACLCGNAEQARRELHKIKGDARMLRLCSLARYVDLLHDQVGQKLTKNESSQLLAALLRLKHWIDEDLEESSSASQRLAQASFEFQLQPEAIGAPTQEEEEDCSKLVMVVDDSPVARMVLAASLRAKGAEVEALADAQQTIDAVARRRPRVILSDVQMPGVDGFGLLERIRSQDPEIPFVLISGDMGESIQRRADELGANGLFKKSSDLNVVVEHVLRQCSHRRPHACA